MKVVANEVSLPFTDHTTTLMSCLSLAKPGPVTSSTRSEVPATALTGEIEMLAVVCCFSELDPEPQPTMPIHRVRTHREAASLGFMTSSLPLPATRSGTNGIEINDLRAVFSPCSCPGCYFKSHQPRACRPHLLSNAGNCGKNCNVGDSRLKCRAKACQQ